MATGDKLVNLEDLKVVGDVVGNLKSQMGNLGYADHNGLVIIEKSVNWQNGYINTSGLINNSTLSGFALVPMLAGETVLIGTNNTNITIIGSTSEASISVGDTITVIQTTTSTQRFEEYSYTAVEDINLVLCVKMSDYKLSFFRPSELKGVIDDIDYREITITDGAYIDSTSGEAVPTSYWAYKTINVEGLDGETATLSTKLYSGSVAGWVVMLKDGTRSSGDTTETATITLPSNVGSVKICCYKPRLDPDDIVFRCNFSKQIARKTDIPDLTPLENQLYETTTILYSSEKNKWENGFLNETGGVTNTSTFKTSGYIKLYDGSVVEYKVSKYTNVRYVAFYDNSKTFISAIISDVTNNWQNPYTEGTLVIPANAKYFRMTFRADNDTLYDGQQITTINEKISVLDSKVDNLSNEKKPKVRVLIIGDSYSANGGKWVNPMMDEFSDDSSYISLAVSSATIKDQSQDRTTYPYTSRPASTNTTPNTNTFGCQIAKLKRLMTGTDLDEGETAIYQSENDYPNIVILQGGENDAPDANTDSYNAQFEEAEENVYYSLWGGTATQGTVYLLPDIDNVNRTIFAGAYRYVMEELYDLFPKAQFFITTTSPVAPHRNPVLAQRRKVAEQQKLCADMVCASVIDWQADSQMSIIMNSVSSGSGTQDDPYNITPTTQDSTDGLHPTDYGGKKLGKLAASVIKSKYMSLS